MNTKMNLGRKGLISGSSLFDEVIRYIGILVSPKKNQKIVKTCCLLREASKNKKIVKTCCLREASVLFLCVPKKKRK